MQINKTGIELMKTGFLAGLVLGIAGFTGPALAGPPQTCEPDSVGGSLCGPYNAVQVSPVFPNAAFPTSMKGNSPGIDLYSVSGEGQAVYPPGQGIAPYPCNGYCTNSVFICGHGDGIKRSQYRELGIYFPNGTRYSHFTFGLNPSGQAAFAGNTMRRITFFKMSYLQSGANSTSKQLSLSSVRRSDGTMSVVVEETSLSNSDFGPDGEELRLLADVVVPADETLLVGTAIVSGQLSYAYAMTSGGVVLARWGMVPYAKLPQVTQQLGVAELGPDFLPTTIAYGLVDAPAFLSEEVDPSSLLTFENFWVMVDDGPVPPPVGLNPFRN